MHACMRAYAWLLHAWLHASVRLLCACKGATLPNAWLRAFVIGLIVCECYIMYSYFHALLTVLSRSVYIRPSVQCVFSYSLHWKISSNFVICFQYWTSSCHPIIIKRGLAILIPITLTVREMVMFPRAFHCTILVSPERPGNFPQFLCRVYKLS